MIECKEKLQEEAEYLHQSVFSSVASQSFIDRYTRANLALDLPASPAIERSIENSINILAVEYVFRVKKVESLLTKKMKIVCYLAESENCVWHDWETRETRFPVLVTVAQILRATFIYLKGSLLVWRYSLV